MCMYLISYLEGLFGIGITCQSEQLWNVIITHANACARRKLKARVWFVKLSVHYFLTLLLPLEDVRTVDQRTPGRCERKWHHKVCARENSVYFEKYVRSSALYSVSLTNKQVIRTCYVNSELVALKFRSSFSGISLVLKKPSEFWKKPSDLRKYIGATEDRKEVPEICNVNPERFFWRVPYIDYFMNKLSPFTVESVIQWSVQLPQLRL